MWYQAIFLLCICNIQAAYSHDHNKRERWHCHSLNLRGCVHKFLSLLLVPDAAVRARVCKRKRRLRTYENYGVVRKTVRFVAEIFLTPLIPDTFPSYHKYSSCCTQVQI